MHLSRAHVPPAVPLGTKSVLADTGVLPPVTRDSPPLDPALEAALDAGRRPGPKALLRLSWADVACRVAAGDVLIVFEGRVYDLSKWIHYHPGGRLPIQHMVGKDATDAITAFHSADVINTKLPRLCIGCLVADPVPLAVPRSYCADAAKAEGGARAGLGPDPRSNTLLDSVTKPGSVHSRRPFSDQAAQSRGATSPSPSPLPFPTSLPSPSSTSITSESAPSSLSLPQPLALAKPPTPPPSPPLSAAAVVDPVSLAYRDLDARLHALGLYQTEYGFYWREAAKIAVMFAGFLSLALLGGGSPWVIGAAAFLNAMTWQQIAFIAHDAGHNGITHDAHIDSLLGILTGNCLGGVSIGWWKKSHNVHHIVTNSPEHDPDIQHMPFLAVTPRLFGVRSSYHDKTLVLDAAARFFVSLQHRLFYIVLCFGRFNLYLQSVLHVASRDRVPYRALETAGLAFFVLWYCTFLAALPSWPLVALYVAISHTATVLLHVQITLSHFGMSTEDKEGESFAAKAFRTTMNVDCGPWMDWFHGGLQYQIEHHLFPRLPRHRFRQVSPWARALALDHGLEYHSYGFFHGNGLVLQVLESVSVGLKDWAASKTS